MLARAGVWLGRWVLTALVLPLALRAGRALLGAVRSRRAARRGAAGGEHDRGR